MKADVYCLPLQDGASPEIQAQAMQHILTACQLGAMFTSNDLVAIKLHVGEAHNTTHVQPELIREVVQYVQDKNAFPFLTETSTLYKGERENAVKHLMHAHRQGFGIEAVGAPFIMADGLHGSTEHEVTIAGVLHDSVKIAREIAIADAMIVVSHPTGHVAAGLGACLKNLGMGLASRMGKMRQHSAMKPAVKTKSCCFCQKCLKWCPEEAISEQAGKAFILSEKCIGCGECLAMCRFDAIKYDWNVESAYLQQSIAEHAYGVVKDKVGKALYINVLVDMTKDCDCFDIKQEKLIPDIGLLLSTDPVAIDKATLDLTAQAYGQDLAKLSYEHHDGMIQLEHGVKIGLGSLEYELITVQ